MTRLCAIAPPSSSLKSIPPAVDLAAKTITVKVFAGDLWSSGILVGKRDQDYIILTNHHVLRMGRIYRVQTSDGHIHSAVVHRTFHTQQDDLALLTFP